MKKNKPVFIFISGGVISGLGKGVAASSIALLLKSAGYKVSIMKVDMYLNQDAGTMNPLEHGEVFVTEDGVETDQDLGHYERFLDQNLSRQEYMTAGQIYNFVLGKERRLEYEGRCIDAYFEVPREVIKRWKEAAKGNDFLIVEMGGTVGEYQNVLFFEAARRLKVESPERVMFVHVVYLPVPAALGEMKSKPAQQSVLTLNALGIFPDLVVCRAERPIDAPRRKKLALVSALTEDKIISAPDVDLIYEVPLRFAEQKMTTKILNTFGKKSSNKDLKEWRKKVRSAQRIRGLGDKKQIKIAIAGKYYTSGKFALSDAYVSVVEAVKHASWHFGKDPELVWVDTEQLEKGPGQRKPKKPAEVFADISAIIVPGGFGSRGVEGKIKAIQYARENKVPFLGLCYGMQLATAEFARNVLGWGGANTTEVNPRTRYPVIHLMPEQEKKMLEQDYGGTMRLGSWKCWLKARTVAADCYTRFGWVGKRGKKVVSERHRHRYELNNKLRSRLEKAGLVMSGTTLDGKLVEVIELTRDEHLFFVGTQFHPEFKSRFLRPHPLFLGLISAATGD